MLNFMKEVGMAVLWVFVGYLIGEKEGRKDKSDDK